MKVVLFFQLLRISFLMAFAATAANAQQFTVQMHHVINDTALQLDDGRYHNHFQQPYQVTRLKYYIGNFSLTAANGAAVSIPGYYLVDASDDSTQKIILPLKKQGIYTAVTFSIGLDSATNWNKIHTGIFSPVHGMFWTWNSGFIFFKLEGKSKAVNAPGNILEYHIGSFRGGLNAQRTITLPLENASAGAEIVLDVAAFLNGKQPVNFQQRPAVTGADHSMEMADNFVKMFSIRMVH